MLNKGLNQYACSIYRQNGDFLPRLCQVTPLRIRVAEYRILGFLVDFFNIHRRISHKFLAGDLKRRICGGTQRAAYTFIIPIFLDLI